jgi:CheY-like chemotaxis protein
VLIVDDDLDVGMMLQRNLQRSLPRLAVEAWTDPGKALARIKRKAPDVVVVDLNMPGVNGVELCMSLTALPERMRPVIVAMSGQALDHDVRVLRSLGVRELVLKDERLVPYLCEVLGDARRACRGAPAPRRRSRPPR